MKGDSYAADCPRCGVHLEALSAPAVMRKLQEHAQAAHGEVIDWADPGADDSGVGAPRPLN